MNLYLQLGDVVRGPQILEFAKAFLRSQQWSCLTIPTSSLWNSNPEPEQPIQTLYSYDPSLMSPMNAFGYVLKC